MGAVAHYIEVQAPVQACYDWWRPLTQLPRVFSDVKSVETLDESDTAETSAIGATSAGAPRGGQRSAPTRTRWTVSGPLGSTVHWDAEIVEDEAPHKIAWSTIEGSDPDVVNSGAVRFDDKGNGRTGVEIALTYDPPVGKLGEAVASLLADPQSKVERACAEFKTVIEAR